MGSRTWGRNWPQPGCLLPSHWHGCSRCSVVRRLLALYITLGWGITRTHFLMLWKEWGVTVVLLWGFFVLFFFICLVCFFQGSWKNRPFVNAALEELLSSRQDKFCRMLGHWVVIRPSSSQSEFLAERSALNMELQTALKSMQRSVYQKAGRHHWVGWEGGQWCDQIFYALKQKPLVPLSLSIQTA